MGRRVRVERVHAVEHQAPLDGKRRPSWGWSFLVRIHGTSTDPAIAQHETAPGLGADAFLLGIGEAHASARISPSRQKKAWAALSSACRELTGVELEADASAVTTVSRFLPDDADQTVRDSLETAVADLLAEQPAPPPRPYEEVLPHVRRHLWSPKPAPIRDPEGRSANTYDLDIYQGLPKVGEANQELQKVALACGLGTLRTGWKDFTAWDEEGERISFGLSFSEASSSVSGVITGNKQLTRQFLESAGAAVPPGRTFLPGHDEQALAYAEQLGYPVVAKPQNGKSGVGVVAGIEDSAGLRWALQHIRELQEGRGRLIVEKHIPGQDYRIYVAYGKVLSVVVRRPASVVGDGLRTVAELVLAKNHQRLHNPHTRTRLIRADDAAGHQLKKQGMHWGSTPAAGQAVVLAGAANISRGGDSTEVLPETHPSILEVAVRAVGAIPGLNQAGVDFLLPDHRVSLSEQPGGICEINTTPALMANQAPMFGEVQPVAEELVRMTAEASGVRVSAPQDRLRIALRAQGLADPAATADWLTGHARRLELSGRIRTVGPTYVRTLIGGPTERVAALVSSLHSGRLDQRPDWVKTRPYTGKMPRLFKEADT